MAPAPMPRKYIAEMVIDRIAASKVYLGREYTDEAPLLYYRKGKDPAPMHEYTRKNLEMLLKMLAEKGEKRTFSYMKNVFLQARRGRGRI